jgi:hypothetical protein
MHVSTKDSSKDGLTHVLTSTLEADGAFELCSASQELSGEILSVKRTTSGGIELQTAIRIADKQEQITEQGEQSAS